jgi:DNA (cytosine-5)-methyltransferase 1
MGWHHMGWEPAFFSDIEEFPRQVLAHHYPDVPCHGDFTTIGEDDYGSIDLLVGGTPCQSFSVAGLRGGMEDERGNLALEYLKLAQRKRPRWLVWENVPGVLSSSGGRDFGAFLGGLVECGYGFAYRVLDAQYFGVAQRRRRVFVVGYLGDWRRAAAVLFERHSLQGHPAPSREEGEEATRWPAECAATLNASFGSKQGLEDQHALGGASWFVPAKDVAGPLTAGMSKGPRGTEGVESNHIVAYGFQSTANACDAAFAGENVSPTLRRDPMAVAYPINTQLGLRGPDTSNSSREGLGIGNEGDPAYTLQAAHSHAVATSLSVRRLTPTECCRLQQFPDDYLELKYANADEANAAQILHSLWREVGAKNIAPEEANFPQDGKGDLCEQRRIAAAFFTPEILLAGVHVGWLQWGQAWRFAERQNLKDVGKAGWSDGFVCRLREAGEAGCSPYRRESFEQCARELGVSVSELPLTASQAGKTLRDSGLRQEAQRAWPLRYALAEKQKSGKPLTPDGPRYKALGNSMAVPVMRWIGDRIQEVEAMTNG